MPSDHPFQQLFETFGKLPEAHSESVNRAARESLKECLDVASGSPGRCILLKAPRAGHGKTHLLTSLQHELGGSHEFIPLHAVGGSRIDAVTALDDTLRRLVRGLPAAGGLAVLDLVARRLFSSSLQPLVNSGEVPCQDREGALVALRDRPIETFDFHHPSAVTAHWAKENFELLGPRLALELSQRNGLPLREVSFWVDAMFRFAATPIDNPGRVRALSAQVFDNPNADAAAHERLVALLGLLTTLLRVVLVADELEGFSLDEASALRFASFVGSLRQSVDRADIILSVNQDVWESAFLPRLSGGLADRLSEVTVELSPLDDEGMIAVIESRAPGLGKSILEGLPADAKVTHARGLIREAAMVLLKKEASAPSTTPAPASLETAVAPTIAAQPAPSPVSEPVVAAATRTAEEPTRFSPEAAIAAFNAYPGSSGVSASPAPAAPDAAWPSPAATPPQTAPAAEDFVPTPALQQTTSPADVESPFMIDPAASVAADKEFPPAEASDRSTDRVDDLLRQFRERYGKS